MRRRKDNAAHPWKGLVAGIAGGVAGTLVMGMLQSSRMDKPKLSQKYHKDLSHLGQAPGRNHIRMSTHPAVQEVLNERPAETLAQFEYEEPAAVAVAATVSETVFGHRMTENELGFAAPATHYAVGTMLGAAYGVAAEYAPELSLARGAAMGAGLAVVKEEVVKPALGLSQNPLRQPVSAHAFELWTHLAYGLTCETVRRLIRSVL
ncbi:MAG: DUF1440 domain-containing protein [Candidatus Hydrogenedentes bacterium]|nr:DUF1440 domain-containing protein [Candidatus Hydrogenedentota bacterium]